jgi:hypothetical protein
VEFVSILGILFSGEERAMIRRVAMAHQALRFIPQTGNFPLRTLIGIIMTLLTKRRWGI